jgi:DNA modification methylase
VASLQTNVIHTGDCRELANLIPDNSVDLVLTDPPFGIGFQYSSGYKDDPETYLDLLRWIIKNSERVVKDGGYVFVFQSMKRIRETWLLFPETSRLFMAGKNFVQGGTQEVMQSFDPVVFWKPKNGQLLEKFDFRRDWHIGNTAFTNKKRDNDFHSCPRPLDTIIYMVDSFCPYDGIVLDWFMGSGTTALAAKMTGREYIGFEVMSETAEKARERVAKVHPMPLRHLTPRAADGYAASQQTSFIPDGELPLKARGATRCR